MTDMKGDCPMRIEAKVSLCFVLLGMGFVYLGLTLPLENDKAYKPLTDQDAGYDQKAYDECLDRSDLSDEAQCE